MKQKIFKTILFSVAMIVAIAGFFCPAWAAPTTFTQGSGCSGSGYGPYVSNGFCGSLSYPFPPGNAPIYFSCPTGNAGLAVYSVFVNFGGSFQEGNLLTSLGSGLYKITNPNMIATGNLWGFAFESSAYTQQSGGWELANCGAAAQVSLSSSDFGPPPPTLSWYVPNGSTTTPDFPVWETNATNLSTSTIYRLDVVYSFSGGGGNGGGSWGDSYDDWFLAGTTAEWFSSHFAYTATPWGFFSTSTWAGNGPNKGISLITPFYSPPYSWSATAYLYATTTVAANLGMDNPGAAIASSTVNFSINPGAPTATDTYPGVVQPYPSSTAGCGTSTPLFETTGSPPYFQINDPIPVIQVGVCKAMGSLFQMTPAQSTDINDRLVAIQNSVALKPPFAFFNELGNTIGYFAVGTTTYSSYNPVNGTIGGELVIPTTTFVLMDASSTAGFSPLFTPIDDGLAVLIYVISLTWLLKRIRYVEL